MCHTRPLCLSRPFPWMSLVMATFQGDLGVGCPLLPVWASHNFIPVHLPYVYVYLSLSTEEQNPELPSWRPQFHLLLVSHWPNYFLRCFSCDKQKEKLSAWGSGSGEHTCPILSIYCQSFKYPLRYLAPALTSHGLCLLPMVYSFLARFFFQNVFLRIISSLNPESNEISKTLKCAFKCGEFNLSLN